MVAVAALDEIVAAPYPRDLLPRGGTGLCLFAAAFLGENDAVHMARVGMEITLVDLDSKVLEMAELYECTAHIEDAWGYAEWMDRQGYRQEWDVVSVDNFTGEIEPRVLASLPLWCSLARRLVTVTIGRGRQTPEIPDGWHASRMNRSPIADWLVLQRG